MLKSLKLRKYTKRLGWVIHLANGLVSLLFLCALNLFLGGKEKISKAAMTKLYLNLTLSVLSSNDYLKLQALTDLYTEMNH